MVEQADQAKGGKKSSAKRAPGKLRAFRRDIDGVTVTIRPPATSPPPERAALIDKAVKMFFAARAAKDR